jgi:YD repeat-containing protein
LNRLTGKSYSNGETSVSYSYDQTSCNGLSITNGKSRRTCMTDDSGTTAWSYDSEGNILTIRRTIGSVTKNISYIYNVDGSIDRVTYPSGITIKRTYSAVGRMLSTYCYSSCSGTFASNATYAAHGVLSGLLLGYAPPSFGGITTTYTYNNRMQALLAYAAHTSSTVKLLYLTYNFVQAGGRTTALPCPSPTY